MTQPRVNYPNRTQYFKRETGLETAEQQAERVEWNRIERLTSYVLIVETLEDFKRRFGL